MVNCWCVGITSPDSSQLYFTSSPPSLLCVSSSTYMTDACVNIPAAFRHTYITVWRWSQTFVKLKANVSTEGRKASLQRDKLSCCNIKMTYININPTPLPPEKKKKKHQKLHMKPSRVSTAISPPCQFLTSERPTKLLWNQHQGRIKVIASDYPSHISPKRTNVWQHQQSRVSDHVS